MSTLYKYPKWLINIVLLQVSFFASGQGLLITSGSNFVVNGNAQIVIKDAGFINNGTFTKGSGTISFTGTTATVNSFIGGTAAINLYNLTLDKTSNGLLLNSNIGISNYLTFTSGDSIYLNNNNIDLGSTGSLASETNNSRITGLSGGYIQRTQTLNAPSSANPGNIGIEITSAADLGSTIIRRSNVKTPGTPTGSIFRYFDIIPTNNSGLNATVKFHYFDAELAGLNESSLMMYSSSSGGINWTFLGSNDADITQNYVTKNGLNQLYRLTLAELSSILPVQLVNFNARLFNSQTLLTWTLTNELNMDRYIIERSVDGIHFASVTYVKSLNISTGDQYYECIDPNPVNGLNYYRLKMLDNKGGYIYSKQILVKFNPSADQRLSVFPNPATEIVKLILPSGKTDQYFVRIMNAYGSIVSTKAVEVVTGLNEISFDIRSLPAGIYTMHITGTNSGSIQFIRQ